MNESIQKPQSVVDRPQRKASETYGLSYAVALPTLVKIAREHGYALAVHGSMATDLDLLASPWIEAASDADTLAEAIRVCVGGMFAVSVPIAGEYPTASESAGIKPHGRRAYTIVPSNLFLGIPRLPWQPFIDLSVTPRINNKTDATDADDQQ